MMSASLPVNLELIRTRAADIRRVHHVLRENLGDLDAYLAAVNAYVQPPGGGTP